MCVFKNSDGGPGLLRLRRAVSSWVHSVLTQSPQDTTSLTCPHPASTLPE